MSLVATLRTVPASILSMLADARREQAWLHVRYPFNSGTAGNDEDASQLVSVRELTAAAQEVLHASTSTTTTAGAATPPMSPAIIYDVVRVRKAQPLFYTLHMRRFYQSICTHFKLHAPPLTTNAKEWPQWFLAFDTAMQTTIASQVDATVEQNVKIIAWENGEPLPSTVPRTAIGDGIDPTDATIHTTLAACASTLSVAAFFIPSSYPPKEWYHPAPSSNGVVAHHTLVPSVALLYNAGRSNPNAKIVQAPLRLRAQEQQRKLGVYESVIVHGKEDSYKVPEGSRSNMLLVLNNGRIVSSLEVDILIGITLVALKEAIAACGGGVGGTAGDLVLEHRMVVLRDVVAARSMVMLGTSVGILPLASVVVFSTPAEEQEFCAAMDLGAVDDGTQREASYQALGVRTEVGIDGSRIGRLTKHSAADPVVIAMRACYNKLAYQQAHEC